MDNNNELLIDEEYMPVLSTDEARQAKPIIEDFVKGLETRNGEDMEQWLTGKMHFYLPERDESEIRSFAHEIIDTLSVQEQKKRELDSAIKSGKNRNSWLTGELTKAVSNLTTQQSVEYLTRLDNALVDSNAKMLQTIMTKDGLVSQNPNLDGYIAEQYHAQTFNLNAAARGSKFRAKVLEPQGTTYSKNGVDIVVEDTTTGQIVSRYQSKYCKDAQATEQAFENGDYRGQQKLTPSDQQIGKKSTTVLKAPDGTTSNPLSKVRAEEMKREAQSGNWNELNWNEYAVKDLAMGIGKQAGKASLIGAAFSAGAEIINKISNDEEVSASNVAAAAIKGGADSGVKAAVAGALKVCTEKGIIRIFPKGTPAGIFANIAFVAIENIKVIGQVISKKLSPVEGLEKMAETNCSCVAGMVCAAKGTAIGAAAGAVLGPVGSTIGGFVGGCVGYMAGSTVGKAVVSGVKAVGNAAIKAVKKVGQKLKSAGKAIKSFLFG